MSRNRRFGSVLPLLALFALVASMVLPANSIARPTRGEGTTPAPRDLKATATSQMPVTPVQASKQLPPIELNVDSTSDDATASLVAFNFQSGAPVKFAFGNRFTLSPAQSPFTLSVIAVALSAFETGEGFEVGEQIGITVLTDATGSGDITRAVTAFRGTATIQETGFIAISLPAPGITVSQGDIYIIISDLTTDNEPTPLPVVLPENGGSTDTRAYVSLTPGQPTALAGYSLAADLLTLDGNPLIGNFLIRGFGDRLPNAIVTGGGQPFDASLPTPSNLTALGQGADVTLSWTAPTLPVPTPVEIQEVEPNDSPAGAQPIDLNVEVSGSDRSSNGGGPGGFGDEDIEDWYQITIESTTSLTITLDDGGQDFDLFLYAADGPFSSDSAIATSGNAAGDGEMIDVPSIAPGTYLIGVSAFDDPPFGNTNYVLTVLAPLKVTTWNIYCASSATVDPTEENLYAVIPGNLTTFTVRNSAPGTSYAVTGVVGASQTNPSNSATGSPCEGGPTFAQVKVKRNGQGKITLTGAQGDLTGLEIRINGVGFQKAPKVKAAKGKVNQKGPLANGQTVAQACPAGGGCTLTITTASGCSLVVAP